MSKTVWRCSACGSCEVEMHAWIDANTHEVLELLDTYWCRSCATHPKKLVTEEQPEEEETA